MDSVNKKVVESRRRITNIHADLNHELGQMNQEVSQMNATNAMKQRADEFTRLATPTNQYEFRSRGLSNRGSLSDKVLSWEATFDRRIEHFVYPSLQTLDEPDIELFDEKEEEKAAAANAILERTRDVVLEFKTKYEIFERYKDDNISSEV